jgi:hypothetical protein
MPCQYALQPYLGHSRLPQVPGSCDSPRGRDVRGLLLAAFFRARSRARRSAAACLRRAACRALTAFRFRRRSSAAAFRLRALKSLRARQVCCSPRGWPHVRHDQATGFCSVVRRRLRLPGEHR